MICQWQDFLHLLPVWLRQQVDKNANENIEELRLRLHSPPEVVKSNGSVLLTRNISVEDLNFCLNSATKYSPWTSSSITDGFITSAGGHRIGICGECVYDGERLRNISVLTSLCIRVAKDYPGLTDNLQQLNSSVLIIGKPGSGKTTFLRDLIRNVSNQYNEKITVLDERRELFPVAAGQFAFERGVHTDVLSGCKKRIAMEMAIRTMSPDTIALDEITGEEDCAALINAAWCGVRILATAHAGSRSELFSRKIYQPLIQNKIFQTLIVLRPDKSWQREALI